MNNFNVSSTGVNIELFIERDYDLTDVFFSDNFYKINDFNGASLLNTSFFDVDVFLFNGGAIEENFDFFDLNLYDFNKTKKSIIIDFFHKYISDSITEKNNFAQNYYNKYFSKLTKIELIDIIIYEACDVDVKIFLYKNCNPNFNVCSVRGNNQGDYAEIIIPSDILDEFNCKNFNDFYNKNYDYICNLCYDAPIYSLLNIDGHDFIFGDYLINCYVYDKKEFLNIAEKHIVHPKKSIIIDFLKDNLPSEI